MADRGRVGWRDLVAVLWTGCTWRSLAHLLTGGLLWLAQLLAVVLLLTPVLAKRGPLGHGPDAKPLRITVAAVLLLLVLPGLAALTSVFTRWQRARFRAFLGVELAPFGPGRNWPAWRRQLAYHALAGPFNALAGAAVVLGLVAGPAIVARSLNSLMGRGRLALPFGCALILAALWVARGAAAVDAGMARALLQPPAAEVLARRVATLSASRAAAVDAADAERRRIERDLHDGTQQRLVSLAMTLGMTRTAVRDAGPEVRQAVADAHEEAKLALAELRDFIRGLHPAVLDELGLDAALSGIAARSPVPVRLTVELAGRPPASVEAVAYFVVSEALANVSRHAGATRVDVAVRQRGGELLLTVTDDGCGGADPARGTGLRGLRQRVESVDGTLRVVSPAGGPTTVEAALPCVS